MDKLIDKTTFVISYITIGVSDIEKMQQFYTSMGFDLYEESDDPDHPYAMYKSASVTFALYPKHLLAEQSASVIDESDSNNSMTISLNVESKESVDKFLALAKSQNAEITKDGFEPPWGGYCAYFKDPEGNLFEVVWHEAFEFPA